MLENIEVLCHSSIKMIKEKIIYFDPFKITKNYNDADIIFITHNHFDHYSEEDIGKVKKENTVIVVPESLFQNVMKYGFKKENIVLVKPNMKYQVDDIKFETVRAYNINKKFHPKENDWVGYILEINDIRYYISIINTVISSIRLQKRIYENGNKLSSTNHLNSSNWNFIYSNIKSYNKYNKHR